MAPPDLNIGPVIGPVTPVSTSRALARVAPISPRPVTEADASPLGRSGLNMRGLLVEPDELVVRSRTPAVALDVGLERARGAFVRNQPADALTLLDAVWEGARKLETGWYLRSGSLALLGLPAEAERLAKQAMDLLPQSVALRFLQSLTRLSLGDLPGARAALATATDRRTGDTLLKVQEALLVARQGDRGGAERLLQEATVQAPDHPAIAWGRTMLRPALRDGDRRFEDFADGANAFARTPGRGFTPQSSASIDANDRLGDASVTNTGDMLADGLKRLGSSLSLLTAGEAVAECRNMLVGLSAGGALAVSTSASRAFAARSVLTAIIDSLGKSGAESIDGALWGAESLDSARLGSESLGKTLQVTVRALVTALQDGRLADVEQLLRRANGSVDNAALPLLRALGGSENDRATPSSNDATHGRVFDGMNAGRTNENVNALPLRLGLALLPSNEVQQFADEFESGRVRVTSSGDPAVTWAASHVASGWNARSTERLNSASIISLALAAFAALALYDAHPVLAIAGAAGAVYAWSTRDKGRKPARSAWDNSSS